ncbi:YegJ family protein [Maribacter hydrothermalis]|nr:DUF2314 domain-containing protein [Maribacter hydrothermalis]
MKNTFIYFVSLLFMLSSCKENTSAKTERNGEPDVYNVEDDNAKMNQAMEAAKNSVQEFQDALLSDNPNFEFFAIKQKFEAIEGTEHIWIQDIQLVDTDFMGIVANEPVYAQKVKLGDTISIDRSNISDWMYYDEGKVVGGYTIRVIRDELSPEEQAQFDDENGLIFK